MGLQDPLWSDPMKSAQRKNDYKKMISGKK